MQPIHTAPREDDETKFVRKTVCELVEEKRERQHQEIKRDITEIGTRVAGIDEALMGTYEKRGLLTRVDSIEAVAKRGVNILLSIFGALGIGIAGIIWAILTHQVHLIPAQELHKPALYQQEG